MLIPKNGMEKKVITISLAMLFSFIFVCFALDPFSKEIAVNNAMHKISFERLNKDPPLFVAKDIVVAPAKDIANFSISATLSESSVLKSLVITVVSGLAFVASGELEWLFPVGEQLNMYGRTVTKSGKDGLMEYTITFLSGLNDLYSCSSSTGDRNVLLKIYSKKGAAKEFEIPSAFFALLQDRVE